MRKELAESFSLSFHPLLVSFYGLIFLFVLPLFEINALGTSFAWSVASISFFITIVMPIVSLFLLKKQGFISSYYLENRKERFLPYFFTFCYYSFVTILFYRIQNVPAVLPLSMGVPAFASLVLFLYNFKLKVSAHAMAMGGLGGMLSVVNHFYDLNLWIPLGVILLLSIILILSRLYLKAHSIAELVLGFFSGIFIGVMASYFWLNPLFS